MLWVSQRFSLANRSPLDDPPGHYALITDLVVLDSYRGRGIGRQLLERAEAYAKQAGATECASECCRATARRGGFTSTWDFNPTLSS